MTVLTKTNLVKILLILINYGSLVHSQLYHFLQHVAMTSTWILVCIHTFEHIDLR